MPSLEYAFNTGTMALHLADLMGLNPIYLIGADFALTDGMFHVGERARWEDHRNALAAPDLNGELVLTREDQFIAARKMETWAFILKQYGVKVVNLTGAGLLHRFMERE